MKRGSVHETITTVLSEIKITLLEGVESEQTFPEIKRK